MASKGDIQATRSTAAAGATAIIAAPVRLRGIIIASDAVGAGVLELTTTSNSGTTLFIGDVPSGDVINFSFPEDGILFPKGIFCKTKLTLLLIHY
jgi:hypothetical protein